MGKPFRTELARLAATYDCAMRRDITPIADFVKASVAAPVYFLGSGGSFSAATFAAYLHEQLTTPWATFSNPEGFLLLSRDLLDQQIIDVHGRKVVRVNDVDLRQKPTNHHIALKMEAVDIGCARRGAASCTKTLLTGADGLAWG